MTTLTIVQARMGSERLPGKVLADMGGQPVLQRVLCRAAAADLGPIVVATSARVRDYPIADLCDQLGVECFRGPHIDVLRRFYLCALEHGLDDEDVVVRVTADCPLLCPELLRKVVDTRRRTDADYAGIAGAPDGLAQECFTFAALEKAWAEAVSGYDREHVVTYMLDGEGWFKCAYATADKALRSRAHFRLTLDTEEDLDLLRDLYAATDGELFGMTSAQILDAVAGDAALAAMAVRPL